MRFSNAIFSEKYPDKIFKCYLSEKSYLKIGADLKL